MAQRVPYFDLTPDEQNAIHAWLDGHGIDYHDVPADTPFAYNHQTGEWSIDRLLRNTEGRHYTLDGGHTIARETVTFAAPYDLPWRTTQERASGGVYTGPPIPIGTHSCVIDHPRHSAAQEGER